MYEVGIGRDIRRHRPTGAIRAAFRRRRGPKSGPGRSNAVPAVRNATVRCCAGQFPVWRAVGPQIPLSVAPGRVFGLWSPWLLGFVCRAGRFSPRFSYFRDPNPGFLGQIEKARLRRWALCALPTPRSQAERAIHRTSLKAAVRTSAFVCATSRGCRWVVSSAHPAREAAGPLALVPRLPPHPRHLAGACWSHIRPNMHTHTHGASGHRRSCAFCRFVAICSCTAVPCTPLAGACRAPLCSPHVFHASGVLHGHCTGCVRVAGPAACAVRPRRHITGRSGLIGESPAQQV